MGEVGAVATGKSRAWTNDDGDDQRFVAILSTEIPEIRYRSIGPPEATLIPAATIACHTPGREAAERGLTAHLSLPSTVRGDAASL